THAPQDGPRELARRGEGQLVVDHAHPGDGARRLDVDPRRVLRPDRDRLDERLLPRGRDALGVLLGVQPDDGGELARGTVPRAGGDERLVDTDAQYRPVLDDRDVVGTEDAGALRGHAAHREPVTLAELGD